MILTVMNGELAPQSIEALKGAKGEKRKNEYQVGQAK